MSAQLWHFILRLTGCRAADGMQTYDTNQPWVVYEYRYTDRALDWFGRSFVRCICCICGAREDVEIRVGQGYDDPKVHAPGRTPFLAQHVHHGVNGNPMSWELPLLNPAALREGDLEDVLGLAIDRAHREARRDDGGSR